MDIITYAKAAKNSADIAAMANYVTNRKISDPTLLWGFEEGEDWQQYETQFAFDTTASRIKTGLRSGKIKSTDNKRASGDLVITGIPEADIYSFDVYIDNVDNLESLQVFFSNVPNMSTYLVKTFINWNVYALYTGWNRIFFSREDLSEQGMSTSSFNNSVKVRIAATSTAGQTEYCWFDNFCYYTLPDRVPIVTFTFDDGRKQVYEYACPILREYGWAGTAYINTDGVDAADAGETFVFTGGNIKCMTSQMLRELQAYGWDISSHGAAHIDYSASTDVEQEADMSKAFTWLQTRGYEWQFFATPYGKKNRTTTTLAKKYHLQLRDASSCGNRGFNRYVDPMTMYALKYQEVESGDATTIEEWQSWIDRTISGKEWLILVFHEVGSSGWCSEALFRQYCDYIKTKEQQGLIKVATMSQAYGFR